LLAEKIAEERSKLPPTPEYLPDLPPHLHRKQAQLNGGAFFEHYSRAYRDVAARRDAYAETAQKLRDAVAVDKKPLTGRSIKKRTRAGSYTARRATKRTRARWTSGRRSARLGKR
jgi:hypothetical protein